MHAEADLGRGLKSRDFIGRHIRTTRNPTIQHNNRTSILTRYKKKFHHATETKRTDYHKTFKVDQRHIGKNISTSNKILSKFSIMINKNVSLIVYIFANSAKISITILAN